MPCNHLRSSPTLPIRAVSKSLSSLSATKNNVNSDNQTPKQQSKKQVAIIGGGIAGLSCAAHLSQSTNFEPTVFDTGRLRPGGRCSSRIPGDKAKNRNENNDRILNRYVIDHAAQILTVKDDGLYNEFMDQVRTWEKNGIVKEFPLGSVVEILTDKKAAQNNEESQPSKPYIRPINGDRNLNSEKPIKMYYGVNGMGSIPSAIAFPKDEKNNEGKPQFKIYQDVWISPSNGVKFIGTANLPKWKVQTNGRNFGSFDAIVIAHNGKCADRLMSQTPAKELHSLLRTNFSANVPEWGGNKMTLNSIYSLTIALKRNSSPLSKVLKDNIISGFIKNEPTLRFITCQTRKHNSERKNNDDIEVWTILSSAQFAKKYKGPQENLPEKLSGEVVNLMLEALNRSLGLKEGAVHDGMILDRRLQLWGAAVPLNCYRWTQNKDYDSIPPIDGFVYDAETQVGVCGDWLLVRSHFIFIFRARFVVFIFPHISNHILILTGSINFGSLGEW